MSDTEKDAEGKEINVDDVLGELRDILRQKYTDTTDDDDTSSVSFGVGDTGSSVSAASTPRKSPAHSAVSDSTVSNISSVPEKKDVADSEDSGVMVKSITNTDGENSEVSKVDTDNKSSNPRSLPAHLDLSVSCSSNRTSSPTSPQSRTLSPVMAQPIIFKTSIKKDPGSKLQDQLVKELNMVLKKRSNVDRAPSVKEDGKGDVNFNQTRNRPTKKVFANKALLANLENHFASRTLKDRMEKQRQSIQEYEKSAENLPKSPPSEMTSFEDHLTQMLRKRLEKQSETKPPPDHDISQTLKTRMEKQRQSIQEYEDTVAQNPRSPPSDFAMSFSFKGSTGHLSLSGESEASNESDIDNRTVTERISVFQKREDLKRKRRSTTSSNASLHSSGGNLIKDLRIGATNSNNDNEKQVTIYNVRPTDGMLYSVQVQSSSDQPRETTGKHVSYINISGCPFIQNIDEGGLPTADGDGLFRGEEDNVATFYVDVGKRRGELGVQVDGPNSIAKTTIEPSGDRYVCTYVPVEVGVFNLQLQWNGKNIPGSPFHPKIVDPRKVKIYGGWQTLMDSQERVKLIVGEEKRLVFDVSQAGPGILKGEVQGPSSSLPVIVDGHTVGQNVICFTPEEEGNHYIHLFWAERTLPSSPFIGYAVRLSADANKVILTGRGLKEAKVREEAEFVIDGSQAGPGVPEVTLSGVRAEINNRVVSLGNGRFHCTYTPIIPGAYLLHIVWNGRQLKGSPYKVNVIGAFFPHKVSVTGEGLKGGILGRTSDVMIDVRKAGPGELTAACMGPSKIAYVELHDNKNGTFQLAIKPMEVGRHVMQIKYGGEHVLGSPFIIKVGSQPDASKVRVTGPGVEHGILAMFQSSFVVETRGAGAGQLTVRIRGPKGGFQVEMYRDSQRDRTILCRYDPTETGLYILSIRWSGVDVPGSPFQINIMDTKQELDELLAEKAFNTSSATPRTYAQWKAEI